MNNKGYSFTWTGFIIALVLIACFAGVFGSVISQMNSKYSMSGNNTFTKYENYTAALQSQTDSLRNSTDITQQTGLADIIGGFFSSGYAAVKTSATSINLFTSMSDDMAEDVPEFSYFKTYIVMIIIIALFLVLVSALLKWGV